ncbi:MAG: hypothetical protein STHCBS139747_006670 [Sporothrix thermara]
MCYTYPCICPPSTYDYLCTPTWGYSTTYYTLDPAGHSSRGASRYPTLGYSLSGYSSSPYYHTDYPADYAYPGYTSGYSAGTRRRNGGGRSLRHRRSRSLPPEYLPPSLVASARSTGATAGSSHRPSRSSGGGQGQGHGRGRGQGRGQGHGRGNEEEDRHYYASGDRTTTRISTSDDEVNINVRFANGDRSRRSCSPSPSPSLSRCATPSPRTSVRANNSRRVRVSLYE